MSYQTAISGLDWQMVPSGMSIPAQGIAAMQLYEQGMGAIVAGNNVGYINANIAGGNYNGSINDIVYDTIVISGSINANRTVNLYYNSGTQNGVKRYTVILASVASSGGPYTVTLTTGTGATVVVPIAASGDTVYSNPLVFMLYVDSSGNVIDGPWKISGGNTNGSYIMFDDGTMICRISTGITGSAGNITVTLPVASSITDYDVKTTTIYNSGVFVFGGYLISRSVANFVFCRCFAWSGGAAELADNPYDFLITTRWK